MNAQLILDKDNKIYEIEATIGTMLSHEDFMNLAAKSAVDLVPKLRIDQKLFIMGRVYGKDLNQIHIAKCIGDLFCVVPKTAISKEINDDTTTNSTGDNEQTGEEVQG